MNHSTFYLRDSAAITEKVCLLTLEGDCSAITMPGQFVMMELPGKFLRRPFSVCDWAGSLLTLLIENVGTGTEMLQTLPIGAELNMLTGLGTGFDLKATTRLPLLIGGGTGLSPLVALARRLRENGLQPSVLLGFRQKQNRFGAELFEGCKVRYTEDVFAELKVIPHDSFYGCGSQQMITELCRRDPKDGQVAFDVRMGCGFGVCMGCSIRTRDGMKRVCKDGPVFRKELLVWEG